MGILDLFPRNKLVSDTTNTDNMLWFGGIFFQFFAEVKDKIIDGACGWHRHFQCHRADTNDTGTDFGGNEKSVIKIDKIIFLNP